MSETKFYQTLALIAVIAVIAICVLMKRLHENKKTWLCLSVLYHELEQGRRECDLFLKSGNASRERLKELADVVERILEWQWRVFENNISHVTHIRRGDELLPLARHVAERVASEDEEKQRLYEEHDLFREGAEVQLAEIEQRIASFQERGGGDVTRARGAVAALRADLETYVIHDLYNDDIEGLTKRASKQWIERCETINRLL